MKSILLICTQKAMDKSLRRSLALLTKSCQIEVIPSGYQALNELKTKAFNLVIIDSLINDIDSLELVEAVHYLDPEVPTMLMANPPHYQLAGSARQLEVEFIPRPFKPLTFLRSIDKLLHQHLERYRGLVRQLDQTLTEILAQKLVRYTFLMDGAGQVIACLGDMDLDSLDLLTMVVLDQAITDFHLEDRAAYIEAILARQPAGINRLGLCISRITNNLYLVVGALLPASQDELNQMWSHLDSAEQAIYSSFQTSLPANHPLFDEIQPRADKKAPKKHHFIVLERTSRVPISSSPESQPGSGSVNWNLLINQPNKPALPGLADRLQMFCHLDCSPTGETEDSPPLSFPPAS
ncbi:MAG TPA: hypothetical protein PKE64_16365 [Anaerolineae bacterium]|nr:hypothetical protein [Anaerolineae bacterium]HMR65583.1 hypothetical protein [Anaerolineae bacterium]